jgi:hypothetical protein
LSSDSADRTVAYLGCTGAAAPGVWAVLAIDSGSLTVLQTLTASQADALRDAPVTSKTAFSSEAEAIIAAWDDWTAAEQAACWRGAKGNMT